MKGRSRRPLTPDDYRYLIVAKDADGVHLYQLRTTYGFKEKAEHLFETLAKEQGWQTFTEVRAIRLSNDDELQKLLVLP